MRHGAGCTGSILITDLRATCDMVLAAQGASSSQTSGPHATWCWLHREHPHHRPQSHMRHGADCTGSILITDLRATCDMVLAAQGASSSQTQSHMRHGADCTGSILITDLRATCDM
ncbi:hypothetical protein P7K49_018750, partial [Saguinus oedipus]